MDEQTYQEHVRTKNEIETLYRQTIALVGDGHWGESEAGWGGCSKSALPDTDSWSRLIQWHGPLDRSPLYIARDVAALWSKLGYPTSVESDDTLTPPRKIVSYPRYLTGTTAEGFGAVFSVGDGFANFRGHSRCVTPYPDLLDRYPDNETDQ